MRCYDEKIALLWIVSVCASCVYGFNVRIGNDENQMASVIHYPQYATNAHDAPVTVIHSEEGARDVAKEKYLKNIDVKNLKLRKEF